MPENGKYPKNVILLRSTLTLRRIHNVIRCAVTEIL